MQIQRVGVLQRPCLADECHFHAGAEAGIESEHTFFAGGRRQQQLLEIAPEDDDRFFVSACLQLETEFHLDPGRDQPMVGILRHESEQCRGLPRTDDVALQTGGNVSHWCIDAPDQLSFRFAAPDRQHAMRGNRAEDLAEVEVVREFRDSVRSSEGARALHRPFRTCHFADPATDRRVLGHLLGKNVTRSVQRDIDVSDVQRNINECDRSSARVHIRQPTRPELFGQRCQAALTRNDRTRPTLRLVWQVEVFKRLLRHRAHYGCLQRVIELALLVDALEDGRAAVLQLGQILRPVAHVAQLHLIQPTRHFLPVAGNEWECVPLGKQFEGALDRNNREREFTCDSRNE